MIKGETSKAALRRHQEGWFLKYAPENLSGIDIGCQHDPLNHTFRRWDIIHGDTDATAMDGVPDATFYTVYASHILEHLERPFDALRNWYRILKPSGHLVIVVPHRELYEGKRSLPSNWNLEHKTFWLPDCNEPPCTLSLREAIQIAIPDGTIVDFRVQATGWSQPPPNQHPQGEYSIEAIIRKPT